MTLHLPDLSSADQQVLNLYKANSPYLGEQYAADYLNDSLRNDRALSTEWRKVAEILDRVIAANVSAHELTLFRATFDDFVDSFIDNDEYVYPAYLSTSADECTIQRHFANAFDWRIPVLIEIHCPAGTPMLDLEQNTSFGGHEHEMLLPRRARLKVSSVRQITDKTEILQIMSVVYGQKYSLLKRYDLNYIL